MPTDLRNAETGSNDLVFGRDLEGIVFRLMEAQVLEASEVRSELHKEPTEDDEDAEFDGQSPFFGRWLPAEVRGRTVYVNAVGELIEELKQLDAEQGEVFQVTRAEKVGSTETSPYEVNIERVSADAQTRL